MASPFKKVAFLVNRSKKGAPRLGERLMAVAASLGLKVAISDSFPVPEGFLEDSDACCVIGGDGTLLSLAPEAARASVPLIGVNRGNLGFLTTLGAEEAEEEFFAILNGRYTITSRSLLECSTGGSEEPRGLALNDIVVKEEAGGRLVRLVVYAGAELVNEFLCDGLIFSTPTGSTAYNLSAGGPIIDPHAAVVVMTPICPHTLSNRTIIFRDDTRILVGSPETASNRLAVTLDGRQTLPLETSEKLQINIFPRKLSLVQKEDYSHFSVVRTKLGWMGGRNESAAPSEG